MSGPVNHLIKESAGASLICPPQRMETQWRLGFASRLTGHKIPAGGRYFFLLSSPPSDACRQKTGKRVPEISRPDERNGRLPETQKNMNPGRAGDHFLGKKTSAAVLWSIIKQREFLSVLPGRFLEDRKLLADHENREMKLLMKGE